MVKWAECVYYGASIQKKKERYIQRIESGHRLSGLYVLTVSPHPDNQLEIMAAYELYQPVLKERTGAIVGVAFGYAEAMEILYRIIDDAELAGMRGRLKEFVCRQERKTETL